MNKKELEIPLRVRKLEALLRRLAENHPRYTDISSEYARRMSGYRGEQSLKYYLSFLKEKEYLIFHNLRLPDTSGEHFFEIDLLIVTPTFTLIIDAKNYRGELLFDGKFNQLIQTYKEEKKVYPCPIAQINRQQQQLKKLLTTNKFSPLPIESLAVFTNPSALLTATPNHKQIQKVIKSTKFLDMVETFEKSHYKEVLEKKQLQKISRFLMKKHTPHKQNIFEQFGIQEDELIKGVCCSNCNNLPMERAQRLWRCLKCGFSSQTAYLGAINDYLLLIGNEVTNRNLRDFLNLQSSSAAKTILKSLNLSHNGGQKNRIYYFPPDFSIK
ncbi:nuclease-related domain-containing protein [Fredinandcohnia quinoae]|uniref:NERD domain-containing protein n=1 Tax=Fredinandcohnia quinoae TaxID=2918902 RepID=A0AAW5DYK3_9BACI|nr:nuclease-related domain-containing protein [Fredinandcohnia sp. SECRCQ15]MCH1625726.1 NERD domain-containing protein [Fredinandcohnia sp. SECRCQ15]